MKISIQFFFIFAVFAITAKPVIAQEKKEIPHTPAMLKPYEGLYEAAYNPILFIRFTERDNHLWSHQEWNDVRLSFSPVSDSSYFAPAAPNFTLDFQRDGNGKVVRMITFKTDKWERKDPPHFTNAGITALDGEYVSKDDPDNSIRLSGNGNQLTLTQMWDKKEIVLDAQTDNYFYNGKESYPLVILKDDKGNVTSLVVLTTNTFIRKEAK